jgi:uncharacterized membrane protein (UPF0127 family)
MKLHRKLVRKSDNRIIAEEVFCADNFWLRFRGLVGRKPLKTKQAFWIKPCRQVHTHFMTKPIDIVFLDKDLKVKKIIIALKPWKISPYVSSSYSVLEMNAYEAVNITGNDQFVFG